MNEIERVIDHTLLKPNSTIKEIEALCSEAIKYNYLNVCVPPYYVEYCTKLLKGSNTGVCTVIGFPMGYDYISSKIDACKKAFMDGATEVDVVVNIAAVKNHDWETINSEVEHLATTARMKSKTLKLIFETAYLTKAEISKLCNVCVENNVGFAKTSTGYADKGAEVEIVAFMKSCLKGKVKIKASGGIRTREKALELIAAGADRIGASSSKNLLK